MKDNSLSAKMEKMAQARSAFSDLRQLFECTICCGDYILPTQTGCGHVFCSGCIQTVLKENKKGGCLCPLCNRKIGRRGMRPRNDLAELSKAVCDLICSVEESDRKEFSESSEVEADVQEEEEEEELLSLTPRIQNTSCSAEVNNVERETKLPLTIPPKKRKLGSRAIQAQSPLNVCSSEIIHLSEETAGDEKRLRTLTDTADYVETNHDESKNSHISPRKNLSQIKNSSNNSHVSPRKNLFQGKSSSKSQISPRKNFQQFPNNSESRALDFHVSATEDEDMVFSPFGSPSSQPLDLSVPLRSPVAGPARTHTPKVAVNFVQPLDYTIKRDKSMESPSVFRTPFPTNKAYVEPRSKPTDVVSPIRKRRKTSRGMIRDVLSPTRLSPFKRNLMRRFELPENDPERHTNLSPEPSKVKFSALENNSDIYEETVSADEVGSIADIEINDTVNDKLVKGRNVEELPPTVQALIFSSPKDNKKLDSHATTPTSSSSQMLAKLFRSPSVERGRLGNSHHDVSGTKLTPHASNEHAECLSNSMFRDSEFPVIPDDFDSMMDVELNSKDKSHELADEKNSCPPDSNENRINVLSGSICDSDNVCVDEIGKTKGNDDTYYSEGMGVNGGIPGCTGVGEFSDSDSDSSFLAPTPPSTVKKIDNPCDVKSQLGKSKASSQAKDLQDEDSNLSKIPARNEILSATGNADENDENFIATDSFENMLAYDVTGGVNDVEQTKETSLNISTSANNNDIVNHEPGILVALNRNLSQQDENGQSEMDLSSSKRKFVFCPTRLSRTQLSKLSNICQKFNGEISQDYTNKVTHLVINLENSRVPQTMKYLFAVADKKWVVIFDWIESCVNEGKMVPEGRYETSSFPHCDKGAMKSRITPTQLFSGIHFYFATPLKSTGAPIEDCKLLIKKMGGVLVNSPTESEDNLLIIGDSLMTNKTYQDWFSGHGWVAVTWEWILDCLLTYSIVPFSKGHLITKIDASTWNKASLPPAICIANNSTFTDL